MFIPKYRGKVIYNKNLGDLFWNTSNKNNTWVYEDNYDLIKRQKLACSVDTRTPSISIRDVSGKSGIVKSASFKAEIYKITENGKVEVAWTKNPNTPTTEDSWESVTFFANDGDKATVTIKLDIKISS